MAAFGGVFELDIEPPGFGVLIVGSGAGDDFANFDTRFLGNFGGLGLGQETSGTVGAGSKFASWGHAANSRTVGANFGFHGAGNLGVVDGTVGTFGGGFLSTGIAMLNPVAILANPGVFEGGKAENGKSNEGGD